MALATYNGAAYLREQLDSIARQTLPPHELVVTDDCSADGTLAVARAFAREAPFPVRVEANAQRLGVGDNFLRAASLCSGEAIAWCDQDDVWLERKLERCAAGLEEGNVAVIHTTRVVDERLRPLGTLYPEIPRTRVLPPLAADLRFMAQGCSTVFRASLLSLADPGRRPRLLSRRYARVSHDAWTFLLANATGPVLLLAEPLMLYRQHAANVVGSRRSDVRSRIRGALPIGEATYRRDALTWGDWAAILEELAEAAAEPAAARRYAAAAARFRRLSANYARRADAYAAGASRARRLARVAALAAAGGYGDRLRGGLGGWSLVKDVAASAVATAPDRGSASELLQG